MENGKHYDVIIIGTGAGGGTLASKLAPTGKTILLLERGDYVPREKDNWSTRARQHRRASIRPRKSWHDRDGKTLHPHTNYYVGGNTKFYGAALFRLRQRGFRRDPPPRRHFARLAGLVRRTRALLHARPSTCTMSTASAARIPRSRRASAPYPHPAGQPRAADAAAQRRFRSGSACGRSTRRSA